jgi:hypothetical protein
MSIIAKTSTTVTFEPHTVQLYEIYSPKPDVQVFESAKGGKILNL